MIRASRTQSEFAQVLGVERSCLSRYEREALGAPTSVVNYCLAALAAALEHAPQSSLGQINEALECARKTVATLEQINGQAAHER